MTHPTTSLLAQIHALINEVNRVDSELETPIEPALENVLEFILNHLESRAEFAILFLQIARDNTIGPPELFEYCMHELRWPEVKNELVAWLVIEKSERIRHALKNMLMAFDDDWWHANLYFRFGGGN